MTINKINRVVLSSEVKMDLDSKATKVEIGNLKNDLENQINDVYSSILRKPPVSTLSNLVATYPNAKEGWTVTVDDTNITYQYDETDGVWFPTSINAIPMVTSTLNGLMSKVDKTKLDTIIDGAEPNLSEGDIFGIVKTQSGHGSGLDADTLDGRHGVDFADKTHSHDGLYYKKNESDILLGGKVNNARVKTDVPEGAIFTDTIYTHPVNHPASIIIESATKRFVSDVEKNTWNSKAEVSQIPTKTSQITNDSEYVTQADLGVAGYGDMLKSVYDKSGSGIVDNAEKVNGFTVGINVPANAKFTDTVYTHPSTHPYSMITGTPTSLPANGGNSDTVGGFAVEKSVPANANFSNTTYSEISEAEINAGTASTGRVISGRRVKYIMEKIPKGISVGTIKPNDGSMWYKVIG